MTPLSDYLFDTPWWLLGALGIAGVALLIAGNNRQSKPLLRGGISLLGLAVLLFVLSLLVDTDRETVGKRTLAVVQAVEKRDQTALAGYLHPDVKFGGLDKPAILSNAAAAVDQWKVKRLGASLDSVQRESDIMTSVVNVAVNTEDGIYNNVPTSWALMWIKGDGGQWQIRSIEPRQLPGGLGPKQVIPNWRP